LALVTVDDYKSSIYYDARQTFTDGQIVQALSYAEDQFYARTNRNRLGYWIEAREKTLKLHSTGLPVLICPFPVLDLVSVTIDDEDITSEVAFDGHFLFRNGSTFGDVPDSVDEMTYCTVVVVAVCGDPAIERDEDLTPTVPGDVLKCIRRMAWYDLRREGITQQVRSTRDSGPQEIRIAIARDPDIQTVLTDWTVTEISNTFDFR